MHEDSGETHGQQAAGPAQGPREVLPASEKNCTGTQPYPCIHAGLVAAFPVTHITAQTGTSIAYLALSETDCWSLPSIQLSVLRPRKACRGWRDMEGPAPQGSQCWSQQAPTSLGGPEALRLLDLHGKDDPMKFPIHSQPGTRLTHSHHPGRHHLSQSAQSQAPHALMPTSWVAPSLPICSQPGTPLTHTHLLGGPISPRAGLDGLQV